MIGQVGWLYATRNTIVRLLNLYCQQKLLQFFYCSMESDLSILTCLTIFEIK